MENGALIPGGAGLGAPPVTFLQGVPPLGMYLTLRPMLLTPPPPRSSKVVGATVGPGGTGHGGRGGNLKIFLYGSPYVARSSPEVDTVFLLLQLLQGLWWRLCTMVGGAVKPGGAG